MIVVASILRLVIVILSEGAIAVFPVFFESNIILKFECLLRGVSSSDVFFTLFGLSGNLIPIELYPQHVGVQNCDDDSSDEVTEPKTLDVHVQFEGEEASERQ